MANEERYHPDDFGWRVDWNEKYNNKWIKEHNLINLSKDLAALSQEGLNTADSQHHETGWLKSIDRLMDLTPLAFDPSNYHFVDVGCGSGISTLYFADMYKFKSFAGFDFSPNLVEIAKRNLNIYNLVHQAKKEVNFSIADARSWKSVNYRLFLYMFNPFGYSTAKLLIENNLSTLKDNNSILALQWDIWSRQLALEGHHRIHIRSRMHKLSLFIF